MFKYPLSIIFAMLTIGGVVTGFLRFRRRTQVRVDSEDELAIEKDRHDEKQSTIKFRWAFALMLGAFTVAGLLCALTYRDASMFYWSLAAVPLAAMMIPVVMILMRLVPFALTVLVVGLIVGVNRLLRRKRKSCPGALGKA